MADFELEKFTDDYKEFLENPLWVFDRNYIESKLTNYKYEAKIRNTPKFFRMENLLSTLWVTGGTYLLTMPLMIGYDLLIQFADKYVSKKLLYMYIIYTYAIVYNETHIDEYIDEIAYDISVKYYLRFKKQAEKRYATPSILEDVKNSVKLIANKNWSFSRMTEESYKKVHIDREAFILSHINLLTIAYISNCYYMFGLDEKKYKTMLGKYTFSDFDMLNNLHINHGSMKDITVYSIDNDYDNKSKFRKYFHNKYSQIFTNSDTLEFIEDE